MSAVPADTQAAAAVPAAVPAAELAANGTAAAAGTATGAETTAAPDAGAGAGVELGEAGEIEVKEAEPGQEARDEKPAAGEQTEKTEEKEARDEKPAAGEQTEKTEEKESADKPKEDPKPEGRDSSGRAHGDRKYGNSKPFVKTDYNENVKSNYLALPESDDPVAIRKQVEFYFSDSNLASDKFLFDKTGGPENRPVPIEVIHSFKRMRHFQPYTAVLDALKASTFLDVVDDDTALVRKVPMAADPELKSQTEIQKVFEDAQMARSVYVKGFGEEGPKTQFDIEAWFGGFGATNAVRLRRATNKTFKGSVFVEFASKEHQTDFLALDPKPSFNGKELVIKSKKQYCDDKVDDIRAGKVTAKDTDLGDWKARRDQDRKNGFRDERRNEGGRGRGDRRGGGGGGGGRGYGRGGGRGNRGGRGGHGDRNRDRSSKETNGAPKADAVPATPAGTAPAKTESASEPAKKRSADAAAGEQAPSKKLKEDA